MVSILYKMADIAPDAKFNAKLALLGMFAKHVLMKHNSYLQEKYVNGGCMLIINFLLLLKNLINEN